MKKVMLICLVACLVTFGISAAVYAGNAYGKPSWAEGNGPLDTCLTESPCSLSVSNTCDGPDIADIKLMWDWTTTAGCGGAEESYLKEFEVMCELELEEISGETCTEDYVSEEFSTDDWAVAKDDTQMTIDYGDFLGQFTYDTNACEPVGVCCWVKAIADKKLPAVGKCKQNNPYDPPLDEAGICLNLEQAAVDCAD